MGIVTVCDLRTLFLLRIHFRLQLRIAQVKREGKTRPRQGGQCQGWPGARLNKQEEQQPGLCKHQPACNAQGISFIPLAAESLGSWHQSAIAEIKKLGSAHARHTGEEESTGIARLFQKVSVALMKGNAALFNNRVPVTTTGGENDIQW